MSSRLEGVLRDNLRTLSGLDQSGSRRLHSSSLEALSLRLTYQMRDLTGTPDASNSTALLKYQKAAIWMDLTVGAGRGEAIDA